MDKNMIHIDDLVKKRLSGGEEPELPGSWMRMRELLDKEMPEKKRVAGYVNWRRTFGVVTGLVLLSALTVGSYNILTSTKLGEDSEKIVSSVTTPTTEKPATAVPSGTDSAPVNPKPETKPLPVTVRSAAITTVTVPPGKSSKQTIPVKQTLKNGQAAVIASQQSLAEGGSDVPAGTAALIPVKAKHMQEGGAGKQELINEDHIAKTTGAAKTTFPADALNSEIRQENNLDANSRTDKREFSASSSVPTQKETTEKKPLSGIDPAYIATDDTRQNMSAPIQPDLPKDSIRSLTVIQRSIINPVTRSVRLEADTVAVERMAWNRPRSGYADSPADEPVTRTDPATGISPEAARVDASAGQQLVPLSDYKVQSRKTTKWNARSFDEVMRDVKFNLAQTRFYYGISVGANSYQFGTNNIGGIQLGMFGLFTFGERWGVMAEMKYLHRFNSGKPVRDDFMDIKPSSTGGYMQAKVEHFFNYTALQSIEMPLALRYAAGRLNVFGGINMAYHFAVNAEEITLMPDYSSYTMVNNPGVQKTRADVSYNDFRSRFALGGLIGMSYEVSPSFQVDFRATKNVWDNAYGLGSESVSRQLYNAPSIQFSLFYRFSQRNQLPKAR